MAAVGLRLGIVVGGARDAPDPGECARIRRRDIDLIVQVDRDEGRRGVEEVVTPALESEAREAVTRSIHRTSGSGDAAACLAGSAHPREDAR